ncbi:MAG: aldehyde dehydrogenase [Chloroflexales bacterium]|nr:aldehyde dehydrogenase [Chloroflexales bacterium]
MPSTTLDRDGLASAPRHSLSPDLPPPAIVPADRGAIDRALAELRAHAEPWARTAPEERSALLGQIVAGLAAIGPRLVAVSLEEKGLPSGGHAEGEEWICHAISIRQARLLRRSLSEIARIGHPHLPHPPRPHPGGQTVVQVYPDDIYEELSQFGVRAEVWMQPGVDLEETLLTQAWAYRAPSAGRASAVGGVTAVLGAGSSSFLITADILYQLFVERRVVAFKFSPQNVYLAPLIAEAYAPLIAGGYLRLIAGGSAEGAHLARHLLADAVHITGSEQAYNAVVFGEGSDGARRRAMGHPLLRRPVTAELGNVTPVIIVPGPWTPADLHERALALATWAVFNGGCLCISPRVLVQHRQWSERRAFVEALGRALAAAPTRPAFYPGASETQESVMDLHPEARPFGTPGPGELPWLLVPDICSEVRDEPCFERELFGPVMAEAVIDAPDTAAFIRRAVAFANTRLWGTLAATIVVHPDSLRDPHVRAAYEQALSDLCYGVITVNTNPGLSYYTGMIPWGAFPGSTVANIQSGAGFVCNATMLRRPEKSLLTAPFRPMVAPFLLGSHAMPLAARRLAEAQAHPSPLTATRLTLAVLGG